MLEANENTQIKNNTDNILLSLEYLKEEAKRDGDLRLYEILDTACILGKSSRLPLSARQENNGIDRDLFQAAIFLLKFLQSSDKSRETVLEILAPKH
tara:strand:+ start:348 stop:638 length:291 start_codon:yes stop_codon:yes gene_type:complete